MRREEMFMDILGGLDEKYVSMAMPRSCGHSTVGDTGNVIEIKPVEVSPEVSKKDMRIYWITRALGMAAALALVVGGGVWLWQNWDKIAVKEPDRPGVVTAVSESITTTIAKPDITSETTNDVTVSDNTITSDIESDTIIDENPENTIERPLQWANPASGMGTDWDTEPTDSRFYLIPLELMVKVEGVVSYVEDCEGYLTDSRYKEYTSSVYVEPEDRTGVDTGINIYTFIKFFDISDNDVREALADKHTLAGDYTSEEVEILLSGDKSAIGRTFSSKWAIVKGEKIYSPYWLQNNSYDKWEAAGITADDISSHFDELTDVPVYLVEEDFIPKYKAIMNNYIVYCERRTADENIGLNDVQTVQPTFEASLNLLREHTINVEHYPNETSTVYGKCTADGSGYDWLSYGIKLDGFITNLSAANKQIKSEFDMDALVEAVSPYCDEQGNLLHDLLKMLPDVQMYFILSGKKMNSAENGYSHYLVGNDFLLEYYNYNNTVEIYRRSEHKTVFRHILELLWKKYNDTSGITAIATDDYRSGSHDSYMMIIGERDTLNSVKKYLEDSGVDLSICRFSTPEEMRNSWLTVTRLEYDENEIYARYPYDSDTYKWFTAGENGDGYDYYGVYTNRIREYETLAEVSDMIIELGVDKHSADLVSVGDFSGFERTEPYYADIFDTVQMATVNNNGVWEYYCVGNAIIVSVNRTSFKYQVWEPETGIGLTLISGVVRFLRDYPVVNDDYGGYHFEIQKIELVYYSDSDKIPRNRIRVIADKKYHDDILRFIKEEGYTYFEDVTEGNILEFSDTPVDTAGLEIRGTI